MKLNTHSTVVLRRLSVSVSIFSTPGGEAHGPTPGIWGVQLSLTDPTPALHLVGNGSNQEMGLRNQINPRAGTSEESPSPD